MLTQRTPPARSGRGRPQKKHRATEETQGHRRDTEETQKKHGKHGRSGRAQKCGTPLLPECRPGSTLRSIARRAVGRRPSLFTYVDVLTKDAWGRPEESVFPGVSPVAERSTTRGRPRQLTTTRTPVAARSARTAWTAHVTGSDRSSNTAVPAAAAIPSPAPRSARPEARLESASPQPAEQAGRGTV